MTPDTPRLDATPERHRHGGGHYAAGRFADDVLSRLAPRLDPDADMARKLLEAGERFASDHHLSSLDPLSAFDPTRVYCGGGSGLPPSELKAGAKDRVRAALAAMGPKYAPVVEMIVIRGFGDLAAIGSKVAGVKGRHQATAIALERLSAGLYVLAGHYKIIT